MKGLKWSAALIGLVLLRALYWVAQKEQADLHTTPQELLRRSNVYYQQTVKTLEMTTTETLQRGHQTEHRNMLYRYRVPDRSLTAILSGPSEGWALLRTEKETLVRDGTGKPIRSISTDPNPSQWRRELPSDVWKTNYIEEALRTPGCKYRVTRGRRGREAAFHLHMTFPFRRTALRSSSVAGTGQQEIEWWFRQRDGAAIEVNLSGPYDAFTTHGGGEGIYRHHIALLSAKVNAPVSASDYTISH